MKNKESFNQFIYNGIFQEYDIDLIEDILNVKDKKLLRDSFKYLKDLITNYENNEYFNTMIQNVTTFISILCERQEFSEDEVIINRKRIKKMRESLLAYSNIYNNDYLLKSANKLDEIILDKNINIEDLTILIKNLIDRKEDINIIKKLLNTNKGVIVLNNNILFDYTFNLSLKSIIDNDPSIYYYIALLKVLYSSTIDKEKYIKMLKDQTNENNEFANEIYMVLHGVKRLLNTKQILNKYGIYNELKSKKIILPNDILSNDKIISIDNSKTKLKDDALSIKKDGNNYIIGIHIANPAKFFMPNDIYDIQAKNNYKCIYIPGNSPRLFSNEIENSFSLNQNSTKYALSLYIIMDDSGNIKDYQLKEDEITIYKNLTYENADELIDDRYKNELSTILNNLFYLSTSLESKNPKKKDYWNKKDTDSIDKKIIKHKSDRITSEFMVLYGNILANIACDNNIPYIYRTQNNSYLKSLTKKLGIELDESTQKIINNIYLPSIYSSIPLYHNGLNLAKYSHSTNPLRRYPDLYNQYLLHMFYFKDKYFNFDYDEYLELINYCNQRNTELMLMKSEYIRALKLEKKS